MQLAVEGPRVEVAGEAEAGGSWMMRAKAPSGSVLHHLGAVPQPALDAGVPERARDQGLVAPPRPRRDRARRQHPPPPAPEPVLAPPPDRRHGDDGGVAQTGAGVEHPPTTGATQRTLASVSLQGSCPKCGASARRRRAWWGRPGWPAGCSAGSSPGRRPGSREPAALGRRLAGDRDGVAAPPRPPGPRRWWRRRPPPGRPRGRSGRRVRAAVGPAGRGLRGGDAAGVSGTCDARGRDRTTSRASHRSPNTRRERGATAPGERIGGPSQGVPTEHREAPPEGRRTGAGAGPSPTESNACCAQPTTRLRLRTAIASGDALQPAGVT